LPESRVLQSVLEIIDDVRGVEVDLQLLQLVAMNGNRKEAGNGRETGVLGTRASEEKRLQLSQGHSEFGNVVVVQLEDALVPAISAAAIALHFEMDQALKILNRRDGRSTDFDAGDVFNVQNFQRFLRLGQWYNALRGGSIVL